MAATFDLWPPKSNPFITKWTVSANVKKCPRCIPAFTLLCVHFCSEGLKEGQVTTMLTFDQANKSQFIIESKLKNLVAAQTDNQKTQS